MKTVKIIATIILALSIFPLTGKAQETLQLDKAESQLTITGTSTLHDWEIVVNDFSGTVDGNFAETPPAITSSAFTCSVSSMESGKNSMDDVVYETLEEENYPEISFIYKNTERMQETDQGYLITVSGDMTIAGQTREIQLTLQGNIREGQLALEGSKSFKMSSFDVEPPSVMFGTIKAGDKITVQYSFTYNQNITAL